MEYEISVHTPAQRSPSGQYRQHKPYISQFQSVISRKRICTKHKQFFKHLNHFLHQCSVVVTQIPSYLECSRIHKILKILYRRQSTLYDCLYRFCIDIVQHILQWQCYIGHRLYLYEQLS